jgi:hypothetical protein
MSRCNCDIDCHGILCEHCTWSKNVRDRAYVTLDSARIARGMVLDAYERGMRRGAEMQAADDGRGVSVEDDIAREMEALR